jgi:hypothetical protein
MGNSSATDVCARCRTLQPSAGFVNDVCRNCRQTTLERAYFERRADFFDDAMNTLVFRLVGQPDGTWLVRAEHTKDGVTRFGMVSHHVLRVDAVLEFGRLITQAHNTEGWHSVAPLWDEQLVTPAEMESYEQSA